EEAVPDTGPRLPTAGSWLAGPVLADGPALAAAAVWVGAVVLWIGSAEEVGPLAEIRTATMAMTPMAAAPIPANRTLRDPGRRGPGGPAVPPAARAALVGGGQVGGSGGAA